MKARLTDRHTLHVVKATASSRKMAFLDPELPSGTWMGWILDKKGALVPNSQFQLGTGEFDVLYLRQAYDKAVVLLNLTDLDGLIEFERLTWG